MSEPTTTLTDALLALVLAAVAVQVSVTAAATGSAAQATWAAAFAAGSIGAALGAVSHGAKGRLAAPALRRVWLASLVGVLLSQALLLAAIVASAWPVWLPLALGFAIGVPAFLSYATSMGGTISGAMIEASHQANIGSKPAEAGGVVSMGMIFALPAFLFFTPHGWLCTYLVGSGVVRALGCAGVDISVVDLRTELPPFYRRLGYVETGTAPFPDPERATRACHLIVMSKELGSPAAPPAP